VTTSLRIMAAAVLAGCTAPAVLSGQSVLDRTPNISGDWVVRLGVIQFNFQHRFDASPPPARKVTNYPTFVMAAGLPVHTMIGFTYSTNSLLAPGYPNEWEFFARWHPVAQETGAPIDFGAAIAYNNAAKGVDGEVSIARRFGPVRLIGVARALSDPYTTSGSAQVALGAGASFKVLRWLAIQGDYASLTNLPPEQKATWSAGFAIGIPTTPHSLALFASNAVTSTLQGASRGRDQVLYGFEFTVPLTLSRWFGHKPKPAAPAAAPVTGPVANTAINRMAFTQPRIEVAAGTTIMWKNDDQLAHTVTATGKDFDSGMIDPGSSWSHTFNQPGTFTYYCTPHPFMKGTVVVK